jgi:hypothetical protein
MKITNKHGLPESFVAFAEADKYSAGTADISVTGLIDSPRVRVLRRENAGESETDVVDMIWALFGTAVHHVLEASSDGEKVIQEERLFAEIGGWTVSGAIDHQEVIDGKIQITDYKVTGAYSVIFGKKEWELQQNCYAQLVRMAKGVEVSAICICAIIRDWNRRKAMMEPEYPKTPVVVIELPLWTAEVAHNYMLERVAAHQAADMMFDLDGVEPLCSSEERWLRGEKWAVMKGSAKRATKLCDTEQEAIEYVGDEKALRVEHRPGEYVRCDGDYCGVSQFCSQYKNG